MAHYTVEINDVLATRPVDNCVINDDNDGECVCDIRLPNGEMSGRNFKPNHDLLLHKRFTLGENHNTEIHLRSIAPIN